MNYIIQQEVEPNRWKDITCSPYKETIQGVLNSLAKLNTKKLRIVIVEY